MKTAIEEERVWITLIGAPDELLLESSAYQEEIRDFAKALRERGLRVSPEIRNIDAACICAGEGCTRIDCPTSLRLGGMAAR